MRGRVVGAVGGGQEVVGRRVVHAVGAQGPAAEQRGEVVGQRLAHPADARPVRWCRGRTPTRRRGTGRHWPTGCLPVVGTTAGTMSSSAATGSAASAINSLRAGAVDRKAAAAAVTELIATNTHTRNDLAEIVGSFDAARQTSPATKPAPWLISPSDDIVAVRGDVVAVGADRVAGVAQIDRSSPP